MKFCYECGTKLIPKELANEGEIPFCTGCSTFRFPIFSTATSMIILSPNKDKILLIKQYGKQHNILVAGYVNKGEDAEQTVMREVKEEVGLDVKVLHLNKTKYFEPSNTLMLNFVCISDSEDLSGMTDEVEEANWFAIDEAYANMKPESLAAQFVKHFLDNQK